MKLFLAKRPKAATIWELQAQVHRFVAYYNEVRPHRARGRLTPMAAFEARDKARPSGPKIPIGAGVRVRRDRIDNDGKVTLRHRTRLHHIGVGHAHKGKSVILLVDGLDVKVLSTEGELLRHLTLRPESRLPAAGVTCLRCPETSVHDVLRHRSVDLRGRYSNRLDELKGLLGRTKTGVQESNP